MYRAARPALVSCLLLAASLACALIPPPSADDFVEPVEEALPTMDLTAMVALLTPAAASDEVTLTPELEPTLTPEPTATPVKFTSASLVLFFDQATFDDEASPGSVVDFCSPPTMLADSGHIAIAENGDMTGLCKAISADATTLRSGTLSGHYTAETGEVTFELSTERTYSPYAGATVVGTLVLTGHGTVTGNSLTGEGTYTYLCTANGELVYCKDDLTTLDLSGTMPFYLELYP
jgi:hypothetical protein